MLPGYFKEWTIWTMRDGLSLALEGRKPKLGSRPQSWTTELIPGCSRNSHCNVGTRMRKSPKEVFGDFCNRKSIESCPLAVLNLESFHGEKTLKISAPLQY